ncbi:MAG: aliphatic sulfonate ABC transporter substrate-binding protein [Caldilinea sp.]|nr:aliphatic sulfonate ABC transporter substrate-binding protein [Caldilinea sp.]MCB0058656.1 aliphatic sulfonate ABC transporter substrate-binding protein [Caldilineaceae bacterium]MCB0048836.1 aliphatic sulfonate ABC transporter substrate-binding protein [Caldilinea sp.]MCB0136948.1 aliphatic sulfonate ABC transporter substrate-binding protein [Caldilineaceae bacterium]MCB0151524.1 aliphatic sulfonate ABC transporter substrate-binding protein [Caldilineaceae bacterium]
MKTRILILLLAMLVMAVATGCTAVAPAPAAGDGAAMTTVRIGTQPWIGYGPWWIAQEKGLFEKYGIQAELIDFVTDTEVNAAFASGNMDVANVASHTAIKLFANGVDLSVVLLEDVSTTADAILAPSAIATVADLAGKTVAYEEGSTSDLLLNYALLQNNMSLSDINPAPMPAADAGAALIAGQVDSAVTYEPYISEAVNQNPDIKLLYTAAERSGLISDVLAARTPFATENPDVMRNLLKVWGEAVDFLRANPDEGRAIIAEAVGSSPEELVTAFEGVAFYNLDENVQYLAFSSENAAAVFNDVQTIALAIGLIDEPVDLNQMVDANYLLTE